MKNYAKQQSEVFCSGLTSILGSESRVRLPIDLDYSGVRGIPDVISKIREFENFRNAYQWLGIEI